ncbi:MAG: pyridoxamine 5'-phosphate oxidase family protein [Dehalococcoidia bacterium]
MLGTPEQDAFITAMKWGTATTLRKDGSPTNSVVFYYREGDTLAFSTTADRLKAKTLRNDNRIAFTVLDEGAPYRFVSLEGTATIEDGDGIGPAHVTLNRVMRGDPNWQPPENFVAGLKAAGRVINRVHAERVSGVVNRG